MGANPLLTCVAALCVPGAGHFLTGRTQKAAVFFVVLCGMFGLGLAFKGELFAFEISDPLVFLGAAAQCAIGVPRIIAALAGIGAGQVTAFTYEYGSTFLIVSGLLNVLVALDAFDLARGGKAQ